MTIRQYRANHQFDAALGDYRLTGDHLRHGTHRAIPITGATAEFTLGGTQGGSLGRVAAGVLTLGIAGGALGSRGRTKGYVTITLPDRPLPVIIETKGKDEAAARAFTARINAAGAYWAAREAEPATPQQ